jgi:hypothetical protein
MDAGRRPRGQERENAEVRYEVEGPRDPGTHGQPHVQLAKIQLRPHNETEACNREVPEGAPSR